MAARGRKESSCVASLLWLAGIFLVLWGPRPASADGSPMEEAKEKAESWANWVQDKVTEGLGLRHENARMAAEQIKDAAGNAASKISSAASDTAKFASASLTTEGMKNNRDDNKLNVHLNSKGGSSAHQVEGLNMDRTFMHQTAETGGGKFPIPDEKLMAILNEQSPISKEKLMAILKETPLTEEKFMGILKAESPTNSKLEETKVSAMLKAEAAKAKIKDGANMAADKAEKAYEGAKEKVKETYETAKDTMTESAKANYEAAKEKASQATGDLGAMMQQKTAGEL